MLKLNRGRSNRGDTTVKVAVITAIGAIIVALITAYLHPNPSNGNNQPNIDVEKIIQQQQQMLAEILQLQAELQNAHNPADAARLQKTKVRLEQQVATLGSTLQRVPTNPGNARLRITQSDLQRRVAGLRVPNQ
jgi:hypothetical protein